MPEYNPHKSTSNCNSRLSNIDGDKEAKLTDCSCYSTTKWKCCHYSFTRMSFQLHKSFVRLRNKISDILDKNREACDFSFDCQVNNTVEVQKSIARIVHLPSVVQSEFYEATRILFKCKENKNKDFFLSLLVREIFILGWSNPLSKDHVPWRYVVNFLLCIY